MFDLRSWSGVLSILLIDLLIIIATYSLYAASLDALNIHFHDISIFCYLTIIGCAINRFYSFIESYLIFELFLRIWEGFLLSFLLIIAYYLLSDTGELDPFFILPTVFIFCCLFCFRFLVLFVQKSNRERLIILGANELSRNLIQEVKKRPFRNYSVTTIFTSKSGQP